MNGSSIAAIKEMLATHALGEMEQAAGAALNCRTETEVMALLRGIPG